MAEPTVTCTKWMASFTFSFLDGFPYGAGTFGYTTLIDPGKSLKKRADEIYCHKLEDPNFGMNKYGQWLVILSIFMSNLAMSFEWVKITWRHPCYSESLDVSCEVRSRSINDGHPQLLQKPYTRQYLCRQGSIKRKQTKIVWVSLSR